jgi:AcrR family transcriptional regulator
MQEPMEKWFEQWMDVSGETKMTDKQSRIVQAAIEAFSEKGYAGTSTSEIAQKAGVAEGTIFRHYKTKKDLLVSIVAPLMVKFVGPMLIKEFAKVITAPYDSFEDFLKAIMRNRIQFVREYLPLVRILVQEIPFHDDLRQTFKNIVSEHVYVHFKRVIEHYQSAGKILELPADAVFRFVVSSSVGLVAAMMLFAPERDWNEEEEIERTVQMIMRGLKP